MADFLNGLFINEIHADSVTVRDLNHEGADTPNTANAFIEIGNASGAEIALNGYQLWSGANGLLVAFGETETLKAGDTATVIENGAGILPAGFHKADVPIIGNFRANADGTAHDTLFLVDTKTGDFITVSYGQATRSVARPANFPGTNHVGNGESINTTARDALALARDASGTLIETRLVAPPADMACFEQDTLILTNRGERPVSELCPGDMIPTYDHGAQPLLGMCSQTFSARELLHTPPLRPIKVAGKLFQTQDDITLSPTHCLLYQHAMAEALFSTSEILIRAQHLVSTGHAQSEIPRTGVTYYNLLFARHAMVMANGIWCESFLNLRGTAQYPAVQNADWSFMDQATLRATQHSYTARQILKAFEVAVLLGSSKPRPVRTIDPAPEPLRFVLRVV